MSGYPGLPQRPAAITLKSHPQHVEGTSRRGAEGGLASWPASIIIAIIFIIPGCDSCPFLARRGSTESVLSGSLDSVPIRVPLGCLSAQCSCPHFIFTPHLVVTACPHPHCLYLVFTKADAGERE